MNQMLTILYLDAQKAELTAPGRAAVTPSPVTSSASGAPGAGCRRAQPSAWPAA